MENIKSTQTAGIYVKRLGKTVLSEKQLEYISKSYGRDIHDIIMNTIELHRDFFTHYDSASHIYKTETKYGTYGIIILTFDDDPYLIITIATSIFQTIVGSDISELQLEYLDPMKMSTIIKSMTTGILSDIYDLYNGKRVLVTYRNSDQDHVSYVQIVNRRAAIIHKNLADKTENASIISLSRALDMIKNSYINLTVEHVKDADMLATMLVGRI